MVAPKPQADSKDQLKAALAELGSVSNTLWIPLLARALGGNVFPRWHAHDRYAEYLAELTRSRTRQLWGDWATVLNVLWRTWVIKEIGRLFFLEHPKALGVNLGAGLSYYFQWFDNQKNHWLDLDLPPVIELRKIIFQTHPTHCEQQAFDMLKPGWWQALGLPTRQSKRPVFLICEGVSMYLDEAQLHAFWNEVSEHAPIGSQLVMDFISNVGVGKALWHPDVGATGAQFKWGTRCLESVCAQHPHLTLLSQRSVSETYGLGAQWFEQMSRPWWGGPVYGLAHMRVT